MKLEIQTFKKQEQKRKVNKVLLPVVGVFTNHNYP